MSEFNRRTLIRGASGAVAAGFLAGCLGEDDEDVDPDDDDHLTACIPELPDEKPAELQGAESIDGLTREEADQVFTKEDAAYQCLRFSTDAGGQSCSNCRFFIPETRGTGAVGGCTIVEGGISRHHWCSLWQRTDRTP